MQGENRALPSFLRRWFVRFPIPAFVNEQQFVIRSAHRAGSVSHQHPKPNRDSEGHDRARPGPVRARALALEAGFSEAGLVGLPYAETERDASRFTGWIGAGRSATMRYLEGVAEDGRLIRARVETPFPWARSAIVCFASYASPAEPLSTDITVEDGYVLTHRLPGRVPPVSRSVVDGASSRCGEGASLSISNLSIPAPYQPVPSCKESSPQSGWMARYAWSSRVDATGRQVPSDYHKVLLKRVKALDARLREEFGEFESRAYVDTGPVVERSLAVAAGLGWTGKNTCLIHPKLGSFGFLAVLLTSLVASGASGVRKSESAAISPVGDAEETDDLKGHGFSHAANDPNKNIGALAPEAVATLPHPDRCGSCTRCIQACPTNALDTPYQLDANRCIAYLTIEHKGPIDESLMPGIGRQVFGCDICQDVCPWNSKSRRDGVIATDGELEARPELVNPTLDWLASLDEPAFERLFNGSPVRRTGFNGLRRNIAIAMGNSGLARFMPQIEAWTDAADEGLRSAARWALHRLHIN
jgi:epoxyqueuosine reductase